MEHFQTKSVTTSATDNWGLSFQEDGKPPVANATYEDLKQYDAYYAENTDQKVIYLTFDAGFENGNTPAILDALKKHNVPATFFVVGNFLSDNPDLIKRMVEEGHIVGNHTYTHPDMSKISTMESFSKEIQDVEKLYQEMKDQGVGVVGMVLDSVSEDGTPDDSIVQKAQLLKEKTGVTYPLLIPDKGFLNGRISGLQSFPESFFVDKDGNIVSDPIMGSNTFDGWKEAVEKQLAALKGE